MKKLFTLFALLTVFMGAKAVTIEDAFVDFSTMTSIDDLKAKGFGWVGSESAFARLSIQDGCLHFHSEEATDPSWDCQFFPIGKVDAEVGVTYTLHFKVKGSVAQNCNMGALGQNGWGWFPITTEWVEGTIDYECTEANGNFLMQCGDYIGDWDIAYLKVTHDGKVPSPIQWKDLLEGKNGDAEKSWADLGLADVAFDDMENNMKVCFWTKEKGVNEHNPHVAEIIEEANGNHAFICRATTADSPKEGDADVSAWDNQIWIQSPRAWKTGEQFRIMFKYKASEPVVTNTQLHKQKPSDYLHWIGVGDVSFTTEWQQFEQVVTVPADGNGMWSIAFNLNPNVKTPVDFYIDDISWSEMVLEHGLFVAAGYKDKALDMDFDNAIEFVYDENMDAMAATVGTAGKQDSWVKELMISTVRGNDKQFKANTLKAKGTILPTTPEEENWINFEEASNATITLPGAGVWNVYVDQEAGVMAFEQVEGEEVIVEPDEEIVPNPAEFVIQTVERDWKPSKTTKDENGNDVPTGEPQDGEEGIGEGQPWDNQFFLIGKRALEVDEEVFISFDYMATAPATVGTQNSENAGGYLHWEGLGNIEFTTEWQHFEKTVKIPAATAGKQNSWTFNLSNAKAANEFHIKNIIFCNADKTHSLVDMVNPNDDNFQKKIGANTAAFPARLDEPDAIKNATVKVTNNAIYNLAGQRVSKEYKGIAIKNGVKFIVK